MNTRKKAALAATIMLVAGVAVTAVITGVLPSSTPTAGTATTSSTGDDVETTTTMVQTSDDAGLTGDDFGLLPVWNSYYNGSAGAHTDIDNDGVNETEECGNCHMGAEEVYWKHKAPIHPLKVKDGDSGELFEDLDKHRGPDTKLAALDSGMVLANGNNPTCGECHTASNTSGFASSNADSTSDPHAVHNDVSNREGCLRCHSYNETFSSPSDLGNVSFVQTNATGQSYGIANPVNMTRVWSGEYLSTDNVADYDHDGDANGSGWAKYGDSKGTDYTCADCHDKLHSKGDANFSFNEGADSRKGPYVPVKDDNSYGTLVGNKAYTCGHCHSTDAHAVHTNGKMVTKGNWTQVSGQNDTYNIINKSSILGAEMCDECHSTNIVEQYTTGGHNGTHGHQGAAKSLGLKGSKDVKPDEPEYQHGGTYPWGAPADEHLTERGGDCGFCHEPGSEAQIDSDGDGT